VSATVQLTRIQQIAGLIHGADAAELKEIYQLYRQASDRAQRSGVFNFRPGNQVTFTAKGRFWTGVVKKINQKTISVAARADGDRFDTQWKVTPNYLTLVTENG
jgi:hypothetical protein